MRRIPLIAHRIIAGIMLVPPLIVLMDHMGGTHWLRQNDGTVLSLWLVIAAFWMVSLRASLPRMFAYRRKKDYEARRKMEALLRSDKQDQSERP